jgi:hypothetical protein
VQALERGERIGFEVVECPLRPGISSINFSCRYPSDAPVTMALAQESYALWSGGIAAVSRPA